MKDVAYALKKSAASVKRCYFPGCTEKPIKAHSISNKRLLLKLSENGKVMHMDKEGRGAGSLIETGRGIASTFGGFCGDHDKIFLLVDNKDYSPENAEQEFFFAMRAAAKELHTKKTVQHTFAAELKGGQIVGRKVDTTGLEIYKAGVDVAVQDLTTIGAIFTDTYRKKKFNVVETVTISTDKELPLAVSSLFHMEYSPEGKLINDLSPEGYGKRVKPCFMTVFPQDGKTYCLISHFRKDRKDFAFLRELANKNEGEKEVLISNLIVGFTENFVVSPVHWRKIPAATKARYAEIFEETMFVGPRNIVFDDGFSLYL